MGVKCVRVYGVDWVSHARTLARLHGMFVRSCLHETNASLHGIRIVEQISSAAAFGASVWAN